jgi:hypothetical protein
VLHRPIETIPLIGMCLFDLHWPQFPHSGNPVYQDLAVGTLRSPGGRSVGKFIVSRTGEAYDAQYRDPNRKFHFISPHKRRKGGNK